MHPIVHAIMGYARTLIGGQFRRKCRAQKESARETCDERCVVPPMMRVDIFRTVSCSRFLSTVRRAHGTTRLTSDLVFYEGHYRYV